MADTPTKVADTAAWAARRKARGAGVYAESAGGYSASITIPNGALQDLGTYKTREEAKSVYAKAQAKLYPIKPTPPGNGHVAMTAAPLVTKKATGK
jgi:hypothetical protein